MGFLTRCKRLFSFAFLLQNRNTFFSFFLKSFLILSEKQQWGLNVPSKAARVLQMSTAAVSVSPAENSAASSATCRRWTAATPFSAHYALIACPLRFAHAMILYHRSSQTASALFSIFSGCMYFSECSPNTCSDSVFLFSHVYVSLARPWFRWALTI